MANFSRNTLHRLAWLTSATLALSSSALALSPINRAYQSARAEGMGNVRYSTGEYEENFFGNPARITENPSNRFQLPKFHFEAGSQTLGSLDTLLKSNSGGFSNVSGAVGKPISGRVQFIFPAYYTNEFVDRDWSFAAGLVATGHMEGQVSQSGEVNPATSVGGGPVFTIARRFLEEDRLTLGLNTHLEFRATSGNAFSILDFLRGSVASSLRGGSGIGVDFDLGTTFRPHWGLGGFNYELGFAINNLLGGTYNNLGGELKGWSGIPTPNRRSFNFALASRKESVWIFNPFVMAIEFSEIGNNPNGSIFRSIHIGAEGKWKTLAIRTGFNQGYLCGGLGFDAGFFALNFATYSEEMGLNVGTLEDRRYAVDFSFQI